MSHFACRPRDVHREKFQSPGRSGTVDGMGRFVIGLYFALAGGSPLFTEVFGTMRPSGKARTTNVMCLVFTMVFESEGGAALGQREGIRTSPSRVLLCGRGDAELKASILKLCSETVVTVRRWRAGSKTAAAPRVPQSGACA